MIVTVNSIVIFRYEFIDECGLRTRDYAYAKQQLQAIVKDNWREI